MRKERRKLRGSSISYLRHLKSWYYRGDLCKQTIHALSSWHLIKKGKSKTTWQIRFTEDMLQGEL